MIETARLRLHVLPGPLVAALAAEQWEAARALDPPYEITPETFADDLGTLRRRHAQLQADPSEQPWLLRAAVLAGTREVVGRVGFHAPPDAGGVVEIGYAVRPEHRRQGYGWEMATGLLDWGARHGATACLASVSPTNVASLALVARLGFVRVGEQIDDEDGLEWIHRLELSARL